MGYYVEKVGQKIKGNTWFILMIISTAYIATVLNMQGIKTIMPFITEEFVLTRAQAGLYSTFFFASATAIALFSGKIVDIIGPRKGLMLGALSMGGLMVFHTFVPGYIFMLILAFFAGIGFSLVTPAANKGVMELVSPKKRAVSMGIVHAGGGVGGFMAAMLLPYIGALYGWRVSLFLSGGAAVFIGVLIFYFYNSDRATSGKASNVRKNPAVVDRDAGKDAGKKISFKEDIISLIKNRFLISFGAMGFIFGAGISSISTHYTIFAGQDMGISQGFVGAPLALFQIGGMFGQPGWGYINENFFGGDRRKGLFVQGLLISFVLLMTSILVYVFSFGLVGGLVFSFFMGFFVLGIPGVYFTAVGELVPENQNGTATSLALIFLRFGVIIVPPIFGYIADVFGSYQFSWIVLSGLVFILTMLFYFTSKGAMERIRLMEEEKSKKNTI
ncbi:MFS transporter [Natranaerofaba carboxydovora]|uniref:MFS transporter n=1 Tax=Natranaerofaba carboxydovora TaxID=2742683 RepID=UPI001F142AF1|nr:MFS transporter [Natranaerofaba carboxydovora]UMZ74636.1 putative sulfoacetate transporter SauU [Natranaerofaba carboxydovora]